MGIASDFLNQKIKLEMSMEEFSQLAMILVGAELVHQKLSKEDASKVIRFQSGFLSTLSGVLLMSDKARKEMIALANQASGDKIKKAITEAAGEAEARHSKRAAVEKAISEAERIIREAMEGK